MEYYRWKEKAEPNNQSFFLTTTTMMRQHEASDSTYEPLPLHLPSVADRDGTLEEATSFLLDQIPNLLEGSTTNTENEELLLPPALEQVDTCTEHTTTTTEFSPQVAIETMQMGESFKFPPKRKGNSTHFRTHVVRTLFMISH